MKQEDINIGRLYSHQGVVVEVTGKLGTNKVSILPKLRPHTYNLSSKTVDASEIEHLSVSQRIDLEGCHGDVLIKEYSDQEMEWIAKVAIDHLASAGDISIGIAIGKAMVEQLRKIRYKNIG